MEIDVRDSVRLGATDIYISALGIGTWAWGDRLVWGYGRGYTEADIEAAFVESLRHGINFFDTAEIYGWGKSERLLGKFMQLHDVRPVIATKFFPYPWRWRKQALLNALKGSLKRLKLERVDLYQIHWPYPPVSLETWVDALADAVDAGWAQAVGVSNYNLEQTRRAFNTLARRGIPLASNQVQFSLLHRKPEEEGLLHWCLEHNCTLIAYSPLGMGVLTGKYTPTNPPPGVRRRRYSRQKLLRLEPLMVVLREVAHAREKTPAQVALNWVICKGAVPIAGAKNARQARENAGALGWRLDEEEIRALDFASARIYE